MRNGSEAASINRRLADRYSRWLLAQGYRSVTCRRYNQVVASFLDFFGSRLVTKTTQTEIQDYVAAGANNGWAYFRIREHLYSLRIFFDFLCLGGLMPWSPPRLIHMRRLKRPLPKILTRAEIRKLLRAVESPRERMLVEVLYGTGIRSGEFLSLKVRDVDFSNRRLFLCGKTGERIVYFSQRVGKVLKEYLAGRREGFVYAFKHIAAPPRVRRSPTGGWCCEYTQYDIAGRKLRDRELRIPRTRKLRYAEARKELLALAMRDHYSRPIGLKQLGENTLARDLDAMGARCGLEVTARILRHTFATHVLDNGADLRSLKHFLGHRLLKSTTVYSHISQIPMKKAYDTYHPEPI
jgi:site-specific recombinase XerD